MNHVASLSHGNVDDTLACLVVPVSECKYNVLSDESDM